MQLGSSLTFTGYLRGGCELSRWFKQLFLEVVSIFPLSLEACKAEWAQPWVGAGRGACGQVRPLTGFLLLSLISDKMFPALGFGAQLPPDWKVSGAGVFLVEMGFVCTASLESGRSWRPSCPVFSALTPNSQSFLSLSLTWAPGAITSGTVMVSDPRY